MSNELIRNNKVNLKNRIKTEEEWINSLKVIYKLLSGDIKDVVLDIIQFTDEFIGLAEPVISKADPNLYGVTVLNGVGKIGFVILYKSDSSLHPFFKNAYDNPTPAFREDPISLIVANYEVSKIWRGIILFHEIMHSKYYKTAKFRDTPDGFFLEEQQVYRYELSIIENIYKSEYINFINRITKQAMSNRKSKDILKSSEKTMLQILAQQSSMIETNIIRLAVVVNVGFNILNRNNHDNPESYAKFIEILTNRGLEEAWDFCKNSI